jgi:pyruvate,orthophosphate dikinase
VHVNELKVEQRALEEEAKAVMAEKGASAGQLQFGTMIEMPRAALTADEIAETPQFFSFGTNDLTQTTFGISRDDAETGFLHRVPGRRASCRRTRSPRSTSRRRALMEMAVQLGRATRPELDIGICGEHGGDPKSIAFCHRARAGLRLLLAVPRADRAPGRRPRGAGSSIAQPRARPNSSSSWPARPT